MAAPYTKRVSLIQFHFTKKPKALLSLILSLIYSNNVLTNIALVKRWAQFFQKKYDYLNLLDGKSLRRLQTFFQQLDPKVLR